MDLAVARHFDRSRRTARVEASAPDSTRHHPDYRKRQDQSIQAFLVGDAHRRQQTQSCAHADHGQDRPPPGWSGPSIGPGPFVTGESRHQDGGDDTYDEEPNRSAEPPDRAQWLDPEAG